MMSNMIKLIILTLAAAALGVPAGVPQAPRPEKTLRNPTDMDMEMIRVENSFEKREVMGEASASDPRRQARVLEVGIRIEKRGVGPQDRGFLFARNLCVYLLSCRRQILGEPGAWRAILM